MNKPKAMARAPSMPDEAPPGVEPTDGEMTKLAAAWARVGAYISPAPATDPADLENLIVATARAAPHNERLFVVAASWLAIHHGFVNGRRLAALARALLPTGARSSEPDREASAVLGALLTWAADLADGAESLRTAAGHCRPLARPRLLFRVVRALPSVAERTRQNALPRFTYWGLWHDDQTAKPEAVRPVAWILEHVPELCRVRSLGRR